MNLEGKLEQDSGDERLNALRDEPKGSRYQQIYRICDKDFGGDLGEMKKEYHNLADQKRPDREVYQAWLRDITRLHRFECIFGAEMVRAYILPPPPDQEVSTVSA